MPKLLSLALDILMLLYADDIVLLSRSAVSLRAKLKILEDYCTLNDLTVNTEKTKVMPCRSSGRVKKGDKDFIYKGSSLEIVKPYTYLGVPFNISAHGGSPITSAIRKGKQASGTGLNSCYMEKLEIAHLYFYKHLLNIPACTPNYVLRLELNLSHISLEIFKAAFSWVIKILDMNQDSLPKICFIRLIALSKVGPDKPNWIHHLKKILQTIDEVNILDTLSLNHWKLNKEKIINKYQEFLRNLDLERYTHSSACQIILYRNPSDGLPSYLQFCSQRLIVPMIQLRLANLFTCNISVDKSVIKLQPKQTCRYCHNNEAETVKHFLLDCPFFYIPRLSHLQLAEELGPRMNLALILDHQSPTNLKSLHHFLRDSVKLINQDV
ncbi:Protein of unknown function [Cotesia congregata]|uniref:Reverse transcriptase domain-containing protein n=1 Tax=Cotesia congregata TaxID=51543 RepID=A0A8J2MRM4_COTCN|nr:Protein of unknown function [Cotesia congregata]